MSDTSLSGERSAVLAGPWLVAAAAMLWGTTGTAQALAPPDARPLTVGTVRLVLGALALLAVAWQRGYLARRGWPLGITAVAGVSIAAYQLFFFSGVARTGVAVGTIVGIGSTPIAAGALAFFLRGERPGARWFVATLLALAGCTLLALSGNSGLAGSVAIDPLGILLALSAGIAYALYTLTSKELLAHHPGTAVMAVTFALGALLLLPLLVAGDLSWLLEPRGAAVGLHLGLVTVGVAYVLFARGLRATTVATAATLTLAEPFTAGLLGVFLLGERLTLPALLGIGLLLLGLLLVITPRRPKRKRNDL